MLAFLNLPIVLKIFGQDRSEVPSRNRALDAVSEVQDMKVKAQRLISILRGVFYTSVAIWAVCSIVFSDFVLRLQLAWMWLMLAILILFSVVNLRKHLFSLSQKTPAEHEIQINTTRINTIIVIFTSKFVILCLTTTVDLVLNAHIKDNLEEG